MMLATSPFAIPSAGTLALLPGSGRHHAAQSVRIFDVLEHLNLSWEVRDGIRAHSWKIEPPPSTPEAMTVRYGDRIAYLTHDALDAMRAGVLSPDDFPVRALDRFGPPGRTWIDEMISAVVEESLRTGEVRIDSPTLEVMTELRNLHVRARLPIARAARPHGACHRADPSDWSTTTSTILTSCRTAIAIRTLTSPRRCVDHVAGMTDRYAVFVDERLLGPQKPNSQLALIGSTGTAARID